MANGEISKLVAPIDYSKAVAQEAKMNYPMFWEERLAIVNGETSTLIAK